MQVAGQLHFPAPSSLVHWRGGWVEHRTEMGAVEKRRLFAAAGSRVPIAQSLSP
jgi:hypothetical protein